MTAGWLDSKERPIRSWLQASDIYTTQTLRHHALIFPDLQWIKNNQATWVNCSGVHPYWIDRIVQFAYYKKYDLFPIDCPNLKNGMPGFKLPDDVFQSFQGLSALRLHAAMLTQAALMRAPLIQDYALRSMLRLLTRKLSIHDFIRTVEWTFEYDLVPELLKRVLGADAAHMEDIWLREVERPLFKKLLTVPGFTDALFDAKAKMLELRAQKGIFPVSQIIQAQPMSRLIESSEGVNHTVDNPHTKSSYMSNVWEY